MVISLLVLPILISCTNGQKQVILPAEKNEILTLECVIPYDDEEKAQTLKDFVESVQPIFPDFKVHMSFVKGDNNAYNTKIKVMMYSDNPPDIIYSGDENFTEGLYSSDRILPLEEPLSDIGFWDLVIPSAKVSSDTGHIYAVPIDTARYNVMLINTALFSENNVKVPENFEELINAVREFKELGITPIAIGGKNGMSVYNLIESFAGTLDHEITGKIIDGKEDFSGKTFRQAAQSVNELMSLGAFQEKPGTFSDAEAGDIFYLSEAAMYCTSSENLKMAINQLNGKAAVLFYPDLDDSKSSPKEIVSGGTKSDCGLLIPSSTKHPSEAVKLAAEMSKYYNKHLYENVEAITIFNVANMEWTPPQTPEQTINELMLIIRQKDHVNRGLCEYNISADKKKSIEEASAAFIAGLLSVDDYLKGMDINLH
ncbi:ABC transporter substrate-binding protein [Desulfosporosinus orientis]|uniref:ABC transporter substrate-binding protein n=1 Tax=Desulfosporosinus orientis TaxID=1563 RepID=UPI0013051304|nr:extracellular solute-binding protein [Desulfosporosinus orientis]